jgi:hypothetical protein
MAIAKRTHAEKHEVDAEDAILDSQKEEREKKIGSMTKAQAPFIGP